jgi:hypothetical protein
MKARLFWVLFCSCFLSFPIFSQNKESKAIGFEWEKIVPFVTKRAEVEALLGKPVESHVFSIYIAKFGVTFVSYYGAGDKQDAGDKCRVSPDTVRSLNVRLNEPFPISTLNWDLNKFEKSPQDDGHQVYWNYKTGVSFSVWELENGQEEVRSFRYERSDEAKKKCVQK